jgi:hypothetical protein
MPLYLQENFTVNLASQLRRGDLDVIVVALPFVEPGIVSRVVYEEPFCVVMPEGHPLAKESLIDPEQVAVENLLLLGMGNCFRDQVVQACPQLSVPGGTVGAIEGSSLGNGALHGCKWRGYLGRPGIGRGIVATGRPTALVSLFLRACSSAASGHRLAGNFPQATGNRCLAGGDPGCTTARGCGGVISQASLIGQMSGVIVRYVPRETGCLPAACFTWPGPPSCAVSEPQRHRAVSSCLISRVRFWMFLRRS